MNIILNKIQDLSQDMQISYPVILNNNLSIIVVLKILYRDENSVLVDIYMDDISEYSKIVSGKILTANSILCHPNREVGFPYTIRCLDVDGVHMSITPKNAHKFYLQFTSLDDGNIGL